MRSLVLRISLATFLVASLAFGSAAQQDVREPTACVGVIASVKGDVAVHGTGGRETVTEGLVLEEGDTLVARMSSRCSGFTPSGETFTLDGPGQLTLAVSRDEGALGRVADWIRTQLAHWIGEKHRQRLITRSATMDWEVRVDVPSQLLPAPEGQVRPHGARLRWAGAAGVDTYLVEVVSEGGDEAERLVRGLKVTLEDLAPGEEYVWKVRPSTNESAAGSRWRAFRVMTAEEERQLDLALQGIDDIEAGVLLLSAGLHEEAIARFDAAVAAGTQTHSARLWRAQALADIGLYEKAYEDLIEIQSRR
jgi:hypothetical protein